MHGPFSTCRPGKDFRASAQATRIPNGSEASVATSETFSERRTASQASGPRPVIPAPRTRGF